MLIDSAGVHSGQPLGAGGVVIEVLMGSDADGVHEGVPVDADLAGEG